MYGDFSEALCLALDPFNFDMTEAHFLIDHKDFDVNSIIQPQTGQTALHLAVRVYYDPDSCRNEVVRKLLAKGAVPDCRDAYGLTALHYASTRDYKRNLVKQLLDAGADPCAVCHHDGFTTPIDVAYKHKAALIGQSLMEARDKSLEALQIKVRSVSFSNPNLINHSPAGSGWGTPSIASEPQALAVTPFKISLLPVEETPRAEIPVKPAAVAGLDSGETTSTVVKA